MITVCIPTVVKFDLLQKAVDSFRQDPMVEDVWVWDNSAGQCPPIVGATINKGRQYNAGVAGAWNRFFDGAMVHIEGGHRYDDVRDIVIANDDLVAHSYCVSNLIDASLNYPDVDMFYATDADDPESEKNHFSMFYLRRSAYAKIGPFDESFWPAYYEDCDYGYRMKLLGIKTMRVPHAQYTHVGSATYKSYDEERRKLHDRHTRQIQMYYCGKWGALPGREIYTTPFNKG